MQLKRPEKRAGGRPERQPAWETVNRSREGYIRPLMPVCARKHWTLNPLNLTSTAVLWLYWVHIHILDAYAHLYTQTVLSICDMYSTWLSQTDSNVCAVFCLLLASLAMTQRATNGAVFTVAWPAEVTRFISVGCRCEINANIRYTNKRNMFCFLTPKPFK